MANNNQALGTQATPDYMKSMYQAYLGENYKPGEGQTWETIAEHHQTHGTSLTGLTDWLKSPETLSSAYPEQQGQVQLQDSGLNQFVPEADDNIDISQGSSSVLQGGQSRWFEIFQNSYTAGQDTIQQGIVDLQKQQADITQRARDTYQANIDKAQTGIDELEEETHGRELKEELSEEYEIKEKIDRLGELGRQMAQLQGAYDSSVSETEMSGITIGQSRGELARKQRKYAERASLIQIESAMIINQVNLAKDIIQNTYNDITQERDKELSRYEKLLDVASKAHLALDDDDKNQITNQINLLLGEQAKQEANKDKIMALAIDPNTAEAFFNSGASLDDTYEQILEKMSPFMSAFAKARRLGTQTTDTTPDNFWETPDGTIIDPTTIEGVNYLKDKGYSYGEILTWYDVNMTSMTASSIKSLLKDAGVQETETVNDASFSRLLEGIKAKVKEDSSTKKQINAMLDDNLIVTKQGSYPLTQEQSDQIRNSIKAPVAKAWDWVKGIFK